MKRFLSAFLCIILVFALAVPAAASQLLPKLNKLIPSPDRKYTDPDTSNTFSIPEGWSSSEIEGDSVAKIAFTKDSDASAVIQYGSIDLWALLSKEEQERIPREDMDNSAYSSKEIAELLEAKEKHVSMSKVADLEYFRAEIKTGFFGRVSDTYYIRIHHGRMYVYAFSGGSKHDAYEAYVELIGSASYDQTSVEAAPVPTAEAETGPPAPSAKDLYETAIEYYEEGSYDIAYSYFSDISDYEDSDKYLRLLNIRNFGSNCNIGVGYQAECGLTDHQKREIDKAVQDFYFADTSEVLLCNTDVACYYLFGEWITEQGHNPYAYFKMKEDKVGGYYYTRSSNLSNAVSNTVSINDGDVRISVTGPNTLVFHINLTAPDCMTIYSYETNNCFILFR